MEILCIGNDITELKAAEQEKKHLERQVVEAQKLESRLRPADLNQEVVQVVEMRRDGRARSIRKPYDVGQMLGVIREMLQTVA